MGRKLLLDYNKIKNVFYMQFNTNKSLINQQNILNMMYNIGFIDTFKTCFKLYIDTLYGNFGKDYPFHRKMFLNQQVITLLLSDSFFVYIMNIYLRSLSIEELNPTYNSYAFVYNCIFAFFGKRVDFQELIFLMNFHLKIDNGNVKKYSFHPDTIKNHQKYKSYDYYSSDK